MTSALRQPQYIDFERVMVSRHALLQRRLAPFLSEVMLPLPAPPDLDQRVQRAVFWRPVLTALAVQKPGHQIRMEKLDKSLSVRYYAMLENRISPRDQGLLLRYIWDQVQPNASRLHRMAHGPFSKSLVCACALELIGNHAEATRLQPLLTLWREGSHILGFNGDKAFVQVAA